MLRLEINTRYIAAMILLSYVLTGQYTFAQSTRDAAKVEPTKAEDQELEVQAENSETFAEEKWTPSPQVDEEIEILEALYPETLGNVKYERSGHQYTTYIVAMAAGLGRDRANELAFYSQFPDDERKFSATLAAINIFNLEYRRQIMATLHSLHGGDQEDVLKRRSDLQQLINDGIKEGTLDDYQIGLMIHAFADSYAHTKGNLSDNDLKAFNYGVGHLFHGHKPDIIAYNPPKYRAYSCALYDALASAGTCDERLSNLHAIIEKLKTSRESELPKFETLAKYPYHFDNDIYATVKDQHDPPITRNKVIDTINIMDVKFAE